MNLGERIYQMRTTRNMSQGDLADKLNVSRQSISKWENNMSVPDLEKIVLLSNIFQVSLDELVKGEEPSTVLVAEKPVNTSNKIAGTILLCMAFLLSLVFLLLSAEFALYILVLPFLVSGIICFVVKKYTGLWCAWSVLFILDIIFRFMTGMFGVMNIQQMRNMVIGLLTGSYSFGYIFIIIYLIIKIALVLITAKKVSVRKNMKIFWSCAVGFLIVQMVINVLPYLRNYQHLFTGLLSLGVGYVFVHMILEWIGFLLLL